jgi:hypothetical protein
VHEGLAVAYRKYSHDYVDAENAAKQSRAGIWDSAFVMPWNWRNGERLETTASEKTNDECKIIGNISKRASNSRTEKS